MENIFPIFDKTIQQADKELLIKQRGLAIWLTGLSGSGKTSIALQLEKELHRQGFLTQLLDGDNIRSGINSNLGFSANERKENIRRIAEIAKLFVACGLVTINCFVSPSRKMREMAKNIIGESHFVEVYVNTPLKICEQRDVKGLYQKARKGEIPHFTGISAPYEAPQTDFIELKTEHKTVEDSSRELLKIILPLIKL